MVKDDGLCSARLSGLFPYANGRLAGDLMSGQRLQPRQSKNRQVRAASKSLSAFDELRDGDGRCAGQSPRQPEAAECGDLG